MPKREPLSPTERVLRARGAAHAKHAKYDAKAAIRQGVLGDMHKMRLSAYTRNCMLSATFLAAW